ncbi:MAG: methyl-accepting chemotaxis protein [Lachnospiraceae bacterium]|nr:methyl-accepting chemotaxis protein [Lachnospiraceae bacterium]
MDISNESAVLQAVVKVAPYIPMFIDEPVSVAITNKTGFVYNQPCKEIPLACELGKPFPEGSTPVMVIESGNRIVREVPAKVYGVPFMSYAIPLKEGGVVEGCLMIAKSIETIKSVKDAIIALSEQIGQVMNAVNEITDGVTLASENNQMIFGRMKSLLEETKRMNEILAVINKFSNSTKILGLNASIEAARAGAAGRGFSVVAKEIERLSGNTTESAQKIGDMVGGIETQVNEISEKSKDTTDAFSQQAASLEEIAATIENLNENVKVIESYIKRL